MLRMASVALLLLCTAVLLKSGRTQTTASTQKAFKNGLILHLKAERLSKLDLEVAGDLAGQFRGRKAYLRRSDLLALPQVHFTVSDDANFTERVEVRGVELDFLAQELATEGELALVEAVCSDWYRGFYPQAYREIHKPVLVLEINGKPPSEWPKSKGGAALGPYLITHSQFVPGPKILAHQEEAQIPWGVVQLEFADEKATFATITPSGPDAQQENIQSGYHIAQQNCLRCHGTGDERTKGVITWPVLGVMAKQSADQFAAYVRDPKSFSEHAEMPPNPDYDEATLQALAAYFRTFAPAQR
jgi:mono/diheme cytochrome c family protein